MKKLTIVLIVIGVLVVIGLGISKWSVGKYNSLIAQGQEVDKAWGQVENVLQRRNDLIPNLVNVVQAYAMHEQEVFIKVAEARASWAQAMQGGTIAGKIKADEAIRGALFNLMATVERYPEVKANQNFMALQDELAGTENRIAVERMRYNESVQTYNTYAKSFPNNIIAGFFKFSAERDYFKADEKAMTAPEVKISYPGATTAPVAPSTTPQAAPQTAPQVIPAPQLAPASPPTPAAPATAPVAPAPAVPAQ